MKRLMHPLWLTAAAVMLLLAPAASAPAEDLKPLAVISVAPVDQLLGDVDYLAKAGGAADAGRLVTLIVGPYIDGIDRTKPAGGYVILDGEEPVFIGFVPTKDLTKVLATLKDSVGEPKDVGDGVQQLGEAEIYLKLDGGYTFVARDPAHLEDLPDDPAVLLGGLEKKYSVAAKFNVKNVPQKFKDQMIAEMEKGFADPDLGADVADEDEDPAQKELREKFGRNALDQMIRLVNESSDITLGWAVDPASKSTYVDVLYTAVPGSKLARQMDALKDAKTNFAGFLIPDAAFTALSTSSIADKAEIGQTLALLDGMRAQVMKEIEKSDDLDEEEVTEAKKLVGSLLDVLSATVREGKFDGGAVALAEPNSLTIVVGGHVVDASKLEQAVKDAVAFTQKKEPEELKDVEIEFDATKHGGVRFHKFTFPVKEEEAKKVFGETLDVFVGAGDKSVYLALGEKAEETLKRVIDDSAKSPGKAVLPGQMTLTVGPILKFIDSVDPNAITAMLVDAAERVKGNDRLLLTVTSIPNGEQIRITLEEGVLQIIGEGAKAAQAAGGGGGF